jgi:hypothetical protein
METLEYSSPIERLFNDKNKADVELNARGDKKIFLNSLVLSMWSDILGSMFINESPGIIVKEDKGLETLEIKDVSSESVECFFKAVYSLSHWDQAKKKSFIREENVLEMLLLSHRYEVETLEDECIKEIEDMVKRRSEDMAFLCGIINSLTSTSTQERKSKPLTKKISNVACVMIEGIKSTEEAMFIAAKSVSQKSLEYLISFRTERHPEEWFYLAKLYITWMSLLQEEINENHIKMVNCICWIFEPRHISEIYFSVCDSKSGDGNWGTFAARINDVLVGNIARKTKRLLSRQKCLVFSEQDTQEDKRMDKTRRGKRNSSEDEEESSIRKKSKTSG